MSALGRTLLVHHGVRIHMQAARTPFTRRDDVVVVLPKSGFHTVCQLTKAFHLAEQATGEVVRWGARASVADRHAFLLNRHLGVPVDDDALVYSTTSTVTLLDAA